MTSAFVDTSAFVALIDRKDRHHRAAKGFLRTAARQRRPLVTSTYIADEAITMVRMSIGHAEAVRLGERLPRSEWCRIVDVSQDLRAAAWELFVRYDDQNFSFTDCTSFALMRTMHLADAFTFDRRDFSAAGFVPVP